jgi:hypothetical protein
MIISSSNSNVRTTLYQNVYLNIIKINNINNLKQLTMTVKELIDRLSKYDDNVIVCLNIDRESGTIGSELEMIDDEGINFDEPCLILSGKE